MLVYAAIWEFFTDLHTGLEMVAGGAVGMSIGLLYRWITLRRSRLESAH